ncbi:hypothetical protein B0H14DRAFT_2689262, partial [Mycena olivaceomarginata]
MDEASCYATGTSISSAPLATSSPRQSMSSSSRAYSHSSETLPASRCSSQPWSARRAEFVVWLGSGFSLINLLTSLYFAGPSGPRNAGIAMIPLTFALVASGFTIRAHRAIARTAPVTWCLSHHAIIPADNTDGVDPNHFPVNIITIWTFWASILRAYWFRAGVVTGTVTVVWFLGALRGRSTP